MLQVNFYDEVEDSLLQYAVIVAKYHNQWVFCKHKDRSTYECPGGHREPGEAIYETAKRELWEETGALQYNLQAVCVYSVVREQAESYGMLYYADILTLGDLPNFEIESLKLLDGLPEAWTYPEIQPKLIEEVQQLHYTISEATCL